MANGGGKQDNPDKVKSTLKLAQEYVKNGKYAEAKTLLNRLNHPKKQEWIAKIEEREAEQSFVQEAEKPKVKQSNQPGCLRRAFNAIVLTTTGLLICMAVLYSTSATPPPIDSVATAMMLIEPEEVIIDEPSGVTYGKDFLPIVREAVSGYGYIQYYEAVMNDDSRLEVDIEISMSPERQFRNAALSALEQALQTYRKRVPGDVQGILRTRVYWQKTGVQCSSGLGAGYRTLAAMNWNATRDGLFVQLDKGRFTDNTPYSDASWYNHPLGIDACKS
jgi:hypothetical protein